MNYKTCCSCGVARPLTDFHRDRSARDGHQKRCKDCQKLMFGDRRVRAISKLLHGWQR